MHVLILARMKKIQLKMKALECSQDFSHYKSMGIFPDAQGQLTPQSLVEYGRNSNSSEILWFSSLPARIKKIRSKMKELECSHHSAAPGHITLHSMVVSGRNWTSSKLSCMSLLSPSYTFTVLAPVELRFTPIYQIVAHRHDS